MACLHFNVNVCSKKKKTKKGDRYIKVTFPKYKLGDELVREIAVAPTYGKYFCCKFSVFRMSFE